MQSCKWEEKERGDNLQGPGLGGNQTWVLLRGDQVYLPLHHATSIHATTFPALYWMYKTGLVSVNTGIYFYYLFGFKLTYSKKKTRFKLTSKKIKTKILCKKIFWPKIYIFR